MIAYNGKKWDDRGPLLSESVGAFVKIRHRIHYRIENYKEEFTMNQEWSLDALYKGYDDPEFIRDMERVPEVIEDYRKVAAAVGQGQVKEDLIACLKAEEELEAFSYRLQLFLGLK